MEQGSSHGGLKPVAGIDRRYIKENKTVVLGNHWLNFFIITTARFYKQSGETRKHWSRKDEQRIGSMSTCAWNRIKLVTESKLWHCLAFADQEWLFVFAKSPRKAARASKFALKYKDFKKYSVLLNLKMILDVKQTQLDNFQCILVFL